MRDGEACALQPQSANSAANRRLISNQDGIPSHLGALN
jgi:hypothetical protein